MKHRDALRVVAVALLVSLAACHTTPPEGMVAQLATAKPPTPEVLELQQGERRVRRTQTGVAAPFILKVDSQNGGSRDLVMGYEDVPPGHTIAPHRHLLADEIIFVHAGSGIVELGDGKTPFG